RIKPPLFLFGKQGESLALSASSSNRAEALLPPLITIYAPRSGREKKEKHKILRFEMNNKGYARRANETHLVCVAVERAAAFPY
ncbi:hypothetical protein, partial [Helicobacter sp. MIT 05-5294]